jgi:D-alanine--poly(phosphoribitol) ligase subunit 2
MQSVSARISRLFEERLNLPVPGVDTDLFETGVLDSLRFVELLALLEEAFDVRIAIEELELEDFRTVQRISEFLTGKQVSLRG